MKSNTRANKKKSSKPRPTLNVAVGSAWIQWVVPLLIVLVTCAAFLPALSNDFVNWDDEFALVTNARYRGFGWSELKWMFTSFHMGHYQPLSWLSFALDYSFWGLKPIGFHLTNIILHGINALLVYLVALRLFVLTLPRTLTESRLGVIACSCFTVLLFSVHPLRVESVAWATQRRDLLSAAFLLSTVLLYLNAVGNPTGSAAYKRWMAGAIAAFAASLFSKALGITFPVVLVVLDVYPLGRLSGFPRKWFDRDQRRVLWEKAPFFLLAVIFGIIALFAQHNSGALKAIERYGISARIVQGFYGIGFYLLKTVIPVNLSPLYELPVQFNPFDWPFAISGLAVIAISFGVFLLRFRWPAGLASWVIYITILFPVLGVAQSGPQLVADRYSYLSCLPWALLAGWAISSLWRRYGFEPRRGLFAASLGLGFLTITGLWVLTRAQVQIWHDSEKLWRHVVAVRPESTTGHFNLGLVLSQRGAIDAAEQQYRRSLEINPAVPDAHNNLGLLLVRRGQINEGVRHYEEALRLDPRHKKAYLNLASVALQQEDLTKALEIWQQVLKIDPADADVHYNLGMIYAKRGDQERSARHYQEAARLNPADADAQIQAAELAMARRDIKGAIAHLQEGLKYRADAIELRFKLGSLLALSGQLGAAAEQFEIVLRGKPEFAPAHHNLGRVRAAQGDVRQATKHFREAVRLEPGFAAAHESLAMALAEQGNNEEALIHQKTALRLHNSQSKGSASH
ncbi:MAG TPA: tetratricopeptide repeat protein [Candidatus Binatia bacterium]|nr:tetratricopeptide repeat protein [Candidatus Binatia bacterium]